MATYQHPITGVKLNQIETERKALNYSEAVTAHLLRMQGDKYHTVAQKLGTNTHRLGEVFRAESHMGSAETASKLLQDSGEILI